MNIFFFLKWPSSDLFIDKLKDKYMNNIYAYWISEQKQTAVLSQVFRGQKNKTKQKIGRYKKFKDLCEY